MQKIVALIPFIGPFPWYFNYFLHSCGYNSSIKFIIFCDSKYSFDLPNNVEIVQLTLNEIKYLASSKLNFEVILDAPYKLCDFKPAYGLIFEDFTKGYDFWIQSDIDVIYGNLRAFLSDDVLHRYDYISFRHDYATGCFGIFRNSKKMNEFFSKSKDYEKVFRSPLYLGFDELNFKHCELSMGKQLKDIETDIECFTHLLHDACWKKYISSLFDFMLIEGLPGKIKFISGRLIYNGKLEASLYHLRWLKEIYRPTNILAKIPNTYSISPNRIY